MSLDGEAVHLAPGELRRRIDALGPWFHNMDLGGVRTAPGHFLGDYPAVKWRSFAHAIPADLSGKSVLDIGCNGGFYAIEMKRRGAARVVAIDSDPGYLAQAQFAAEVAGVTIELQALSVYDVGLLGERFDIVLFLGVLYHLRHPLLALDLIHAHVARDLLVFQAMQRGAGGAPGERPAEDYPFEETAAFDRPSWPKLHFIERSYAGDCTNWWAPNGPCAEAMLRSAGFDVLSRPEAEVLIAARREIAVPPDGPHAVYPRRSGPLAAAAAVTGEALGGGERRPGHPPAVATASIVDGDAP